MDLIPTITPKPPEPVSETPTRIQTAKPISFSNGIIKRHHHHHPLHFTYKECLKNHAAALGGHALDGCGEFMPSPSLISTDPTSLKCAACGCHRNFHRREPDNDSSSNPPLPSTVAAAIEYQPHHRHHPPPPQTAPHPPTRSPNSSSPPPISSSYMLLSLSGPNNNNLAFSDLNFSNNHHPIGSRKRFRTKFSQFQKDKMHEFANRVGWKMQKRDEDDVRNFCRQIGVDKSVLKVWMHNNKNTFNRRDLPFSVAGSAENRKNDDRREGNHAPIPTGETNNNNNNNGCNELHHSVSSGGGGYDSDSGGGGTHGGNVNGSSSS